VTLTTHPHLVPRSRMSRSYISSPPSASMACRGTALPFMEQVEILFILSLHWIFETLKNSIECTSTSRLVKTLTSIQQILSPAPGLNIGNPYASFPLFSSVTWAKFPDNIMTPLLNSGVNYRNNSGNITKTNFPSDDYESVNSSYERDGICINTHF
jgi:hypothetical protein